MELNTREKGVLALLRLNEVSKKREIRKRLSIGRLEIVFNWRSRHNLWGRFGGGWQWVVGIEVGSTTVILNLLICSLRFSVKKPPSASESSE